MRILPAEVARAPHAFSGHPTYAGPFMKVQTSKVFFGPDGLVKDFRLTDKGT
jgi:hypothetical protein